MNEGTQGITFLWISKWTTFYRECVFLGGMVGVVLHFGWNRFNFVKAPDPDISKERGKISTALFGQQKEKNIIYVLINV